MVWGRKQGSMEENLSFSSSPASFSHRGAAILLLHSPEETGPSILPLRIHKTSPFPPKAVLPTLWESTAFTPLFLEQNGTEKKLRHSLLLLQKRRAREPRRKPQRTVFLHFFLLQSMQLVWHKGDVAMTVSTHSSSSLTKPWIGAGCWNKLIPATSHGRKAGTLSPCAGLLFT